MCCVFVSPQPQDIYNDAKAPPHCCRNITDPPYPQNAIFVTFLFFFRYFSLFFVGIALFAILYAWVCFNGKFPRDWIVYQVHCVLPEMLLHSPLRREFWFNMTDFSKMSFSATKMGCAQAILLYIFICSHWYIKDRIGEWWERLLRGLCHHVSL